MLHAYAAPGGYVATLEVCDKDGLCDTTLARSWSRSATRHSTEAFITFIEEPTGDLPELAGRSAHLERDQHTSSPHRAQVPEMRPEGCAQRVMRDVADTVTLSVALDDLGDIRVVSVRHPRE